MQIKYATEQLHYPVWGMSPSSTADDTGGYGIFGVEGLTFPYTVRAASRQCSTLRDRDDVTPHASFLALDVAPQQAYANIQRLRRLYPDIYTADGGFYDAVNPTTGAVGHRRLVLDQSMIMAALDNALNGALQRHFAADPVSWAAHAYLSLEGMSSGSPALLSKLSGPPRWERTGRIVRGQSATVKESVIVAVELSPA